MLSPRYHRETAQRFRLEAGKCKGCGKIHFPPRHVCKECGSTEFEMTVLPGKGKVVSFTTIHIPPAEFEDLKPYVTAIIELENGVRLTAMVAEAPPDEVEIGTEVEMIFRRIKKESEWGILQYGYKARVL